MPTPLCLIILLTLSLVDAYCFPLITDRGLIRAIIVAAVDTATKRIAYQLWTSIGAALACPSALHGVNRHSHPHLSFIGVNTCCRIWKFFATTRQAKLFRLVLLFSGKVLI